MSAEGRLVTQGHPNGRPVGGGYVWRPDDEGRAEADAAFLADVRRRVLERHKAGLPLEIDTDLSGPPASRAGESDLPAGAGATPPVTTAPCSADLAVSMAKGDSWPAAQPETPDLPAGAGYLGPVTTAPCPSGDPVKGDSRPADPPERCDDCGYLKTARGHLMSCGGG